jgi:quercetin dioxygenase-like cupin family protein
VGHRRADGPPGTSGVTGQVIHSDPSGVISELAFGRNGRIEPHTNPNTTWFIVIEGGGWVVVDHERLRVAAGEAVLWPPGVPHGAWADHGTMRAFIVEYSDADGPLRGGLLESGAAETARRIARGEGHLAGAGHVPPPDPEAGEPT